MVDPSRAPVAFGRRAVPRLFEDLQPPDTGTRLRALNSLCDLVHDPERLHQTVCGGFLEQLQVLLKDEDPSVRANTCRLLHLVVTCSIGRQALLDSSLLPPLCLLLDDSSASCRTGTLQVLDLLSQLPAGAAALLDLVPRLMLKLRENQEAEEEVLLLSIVGRCSRLDALPALTSHGVHLLGRRLAHCQHAVRREAAAAMMALSVPVEGKRQVCEEQLLLPLIVLLKDPEIEVQVNAAGVIMNTVIITPGKLQCLDLDILPVLLKLISASPPEEKEEEEEEEDEERRRRRKALTLYSLRALTALAEAPGGRRLLLNELPLFMRRTEEPEEDQDIRRAAQTAIKVVSWTP